MSILYYGADGCIHQLGDNELAHYKYIKKIKIGNTYRYFYTMDALEAYYNDRKKVAEAEYLIDRGKDKKDQLKRSASIKKDYVNDRWNGKSKEEAKKKHDRSEALNNAIYETQGGYRKVKKTVKPVAETAKLAVTPMKSPKESVIKFMDKKITTPISDIKKKSNDYAKTVSSNNLKSAKKAYKKSKKIRQKNPNAHPILTYKPQELEFVKREAQRKRKK